MARAEEAKPQAEQAPLQAEEARVEAERRVQVLEARSNSGFQQSALRTQEELDTQVAEALRRERDRLSVATRNQVVFKQRWQQYASQSDTERARQLEEFERKVNARMESANRRCKVST